MFHVWTRKTVSDLSGTDLFVPKSHSALRYGGRSEGRGLALGSSLVLEFHDTRASIVARRLANPPRLAGIRNVSWLSSIDAHHSLGLKP
jgi:hypothetical protein